MTRPLEELLRTADVTAAAVLVIGRDGTVRVWRPQDLLDWTGTARLRGDIARALHTAPALQHDSGFKP